MSTISSLQKYMFLTIFKFERSKVTKLNQNNKMMGNALFTIKKRCKILQLKNYFTLKFNITFIISQ